MTKPFEHVQRIVLHGSLWSVARHLVLDFAEPTAPLRFLAELKSSQWPTAARLPKPELQTSLGFSRRGLERAGVPLNVLACFALKSPAFSAGAALRASSHLGATGRNVPGAWDAAFDFQTLDAVLSLHAMSRIGLDTATAGVHTIAKATGVRIKELPVAGRLANPPAGVEQDSKAQWVHFGYRDGLSRVGIEGWTGHKQLGECLDISTHQAGEFLLGHAQDCGANPWIAGPGVRVWPKALRAFFHDGSFGVLHQVEQHVGAFERFVEAQVAALRLDAAEVKGKLCGRYPNGRSLAVDAKEVPGPDFNYEGDPDGLRCPFGSHVRRMNPRDGALVESARSRALLRRGMPYGNPDAEEAEQLGLMGQFFCASIEDQFEHLLGQWADRVPLGSKDRGLARDPLAGAHQPGDGAFEIPRQDQDPLRVTGLLPFTRTRGTAYLFYPSLETLAKIAEDDMWGAEGEDDA